MKAEKLIGWNLFPKLVTGIKNNGMSTMFLLSCAGARPQNKLNGPAHTGLFPRSWNLLLKTLLEAGFFSGCAKFYCTNQ